MVDMGEGKQHYVRRFVTCIGMTVLVILCFCFGVVLDNAVIVFASIVFASLVMVLLWGRLGTDLESLVFMGEGKQHRVLRLVIGIGRTLFCIVALLCGLLMVNLGLTYNHWVLVAAGASFIFASAVYSYFYFFVLRKLPRPTATVHYNWGVSLSQNGNMEGAIMHYREAIRLDPGNAWRHKDLAECLETQGDVDGAIEEYRAAIKLDPAYAAAHFNLARTHGRKGDAKAAVESLRKAIDLEETWREQAKKDADFDPIRNAPEFRKLVYGE